MNWIVIILVIAAIVWWVKRNQRNQNGKPLNRAPTQLPRQNMQQNHSNGSLNSPNPQQQKPVGAIDRRCSYCDRVAGIKETFCQSCGAKLPAPPQQENTVSGKHQNQQEKTFSDGSQTQQAAYRGDSGSSMLGDTVKTGAAIMATHAILGGLMGSAHASHQTSADLLITPDADGSASSDSIFGNRTDLSPDFLPGDGSDENKPMSSSVLDGGLSSLDSLGSPGDSNTAWITDEDNFRDDFNDSWSSTDDDSSFDSDWSSFGDDD